MVCVILLASAALLGTFGIMKRQISAVLITGVMYILAGLLKISHLARVRTVYIIIIELMPSDLKQKWENKREFKINGKWFLISVQLSLPSSRSSSCTASETVGVKRALLTIR
jgi:uncharacterized membrane protein YkvI